MCLLTSRIVPSIARKDIEVYKLLIVCNRKVFTPFTGTHIPKIPYTMIPVGHPLIKGTLGGHYKLEEGFIHAFTQLEGIKHLDTTTWRNNYYSIIAKCHIPAGSEYYTDDYSLNICADKLVIDDILPHDEAEKYIDCPVASDALAEELLRKSVTVVPKIEFEEVCVL